MTSSARPRVTTLLFSPFVLIAGASSLLLGLAVILLSGGLGYLGDVHFDGVLDVHTGARLPLWLTLSEGLLDWLSLAAVLYLAGRLLSRTAFRALDLFGTQALARWPMLLVTLVCLAPGFQRFSRQLIELLPQMAANPNALQMPPLGLDAAVFGMVTLIMLLCTVWMIALMWKSFSHCCNVRGGRAVTGFIISLLIAEVLSKVILTQLLKML